MKRLQTRQDRVDRSRMRILVLVVVVAVLGAACSSAGNSTVIVTGNGRCVGNTSYVDGGVYGSAAIGNSYTAVEGAGTWTLLAGPEQVMYIASVREKPAESVITELEASSEVIFVEGQGCKGRTWLSTTITGTQGVVGVVEGSNSTLVIVAARPDGVGAGVRRGMEEILRTWRYDD